MIRTELYMTRRGKNYYITYSDAGMYIERDGVRYVEAIDPEGTNRVYTETDELIPQPEPEPTEEEEATEEEAEVNEE